MYEGIRRFSTGEGEEEGEEEERRRRRGHRKNVSGSRFRRCAPREEGEEEEEEGEGLRDDGIQTRRTFLEPVDICYVRTVYLSRPRPFIYNGERNKPIAACTDGGSPAGRRR